MVNGISSYNNSNLGFYRAVAGNVVYHQNDIKSMVNFLNGEPVIEASSEAESVKSAVVGTLPFAGIFGVIQGIPVLKNNDWSIKKAIETTNASSPYAKRGEWLKAGHENLSKNYGNIFQKHIELDTSKRWFVGKCLDKIPGYKALRATGFGQAMGKSGAGWMAVIDGGIKTFTDVVPAFQQLGFESGMKQVAKTGTEVAAGALGWVAGDAVGSAVGSAIGTLICPGVGTAIGGFLGKFFGGVIGGAIAGKCAKAVTGKTEIQKHKDEQMAQVSQQIEADPQTKISLAQQAYQKATEVLAQDPNNQDAKIAKASAEKVLMTEQAQQEQAQAQQTQPAQQAQYQPSFAGVPTVPGFNGYGYDMNILRQSNANASSMNYQTASNPFANNQVL